MREPVRVDEFVYRGQDVLVAGDVVERRRSVLFNPLQWNVSLGRCFACVKRMRLRQYIPWETVLCLDWQVGRRSLALCGL